MQIQDQTLPFGIKLVAVGLTLLVTGRWIGGELLGLLRRAFEMMAST
jgi:type III secretion protein S